jgi:hypothetical protein
MVIAALHDDDGVVDGLVNETVFAIDAPRPVTGPLTAS